MANLKVSAESLLNSCVELSRQGIMQMDTVKAAKPAPAAMVKVIIQDGFDDFVSVHEIVVL